MITLGYQQNLTLNPGLYSIDLDGYIFNASVILLSYLWSLQLSKYFGNFINN
jgi:hypothetical protein